MQWDARRRLLRRTVALVADAEKHPGIRLPGIRFAGGCCDNTYRTAINASAKSRCGSTPESPSRGPRGVAPAEAWRLPSTACAPPLRVDPQEIAREASCDIDKDVQRTFPSTRRFHSEEGQTQLRNVLRAYAAYDPEVAYCQGMNFIAGLLLLYMPSEGHAFAALVLLMEDRGLRSFYHRSLSLLQASTTCTLRARHNA